MATFRFSSKTSNLTKSSNFLLIPLSWHSNACHIYQQVVLLGWFLNTFGIIFTLKIQWVDSFNYSNFFFILHRPHPPQIAHVLGVASLLTMTKPSGGIHPIVVGEICLQFCEVFATHFSPHQFGVATKGGYEAIIHSITYTLTQTGLFFN